MDAGIYARISLDRDETHLGVDRQLEDCQEEASRRGWTVQQRYVDNSISATRSKTRPEYERMLSDVRTGRIQALIVWDVDRLTRTPRELEDIIDLAAAHGLQLANVGGDIDLSTPQGKMMARIKGTVARHETDQQSRRMKRRIEQKALAGEPHGLIPWGYSRVRTTLENGQVGPARDVPDPEVAPIIVEAAERFVRGESLRSITLDFDARGIAAPRADKWNPTSLRQVLRRQSNIGKRTHKGEVIGNSTAEPIMTEALFEQVIARLNDPDRKKMAMGNAPKHLLSRIAVCGLCGGKMRFLSGRVENGKRQPPAYGCMECFKIRRHKQIVDDVVEGAIVARLQLPDFLAHVSAGEPDKQRLAQSELNELEARLSNAADQYADDEITGEQLARISKRLRPKIDQAKADMVNAEPTRLFEGLTGADALTSWKQASLDVQRLIVQQLMEVTILPVGSGHNANPEAIRIDWK